MDAFAEIDEILNLMPEELLKKIPNKFHKMIHEEKNTEYVTNIKEPLENCKLKKETIVILGLIYRDFLCSTEERKILQEKDLKEIKKVKDKLEIEMRDKYNPDDIFKKKKEENQKENELNKENSLTVIIKEKWYKKIFNIIKKIFK